MPTGRTRSSWRRRWPMHEPRVRPGRPLAWLAMLAAAALMAGCATAYWQGRAALREGRFAEAAARFEQALAEDPERVGALTGLGVARYKQGDLPEAAEALARAVARAPRDGAARLYLALAHLRMGDLEAARGQMAAALEGPLEPRLAAQLRRALGVFDAEAAPSAGCRQFMAAALEDGIEWAEELAEARRQALLAPRFYEPPLRHLYLSPSGRFFYCY
jgi:tetratricopeptide (TPR) repeat protein